MFVALGGITPESALELYSNPIKLILVYGIQLVTGAFLLAGYTNYFLCIGKSGNGQFSDFTNGFGSGIKFIGLFILYYIATVIGFMLFIIPGIILSIGLCLAPFIVLDNKDMGIIDAIKESWELTKKKKLALFGYGFLFFIISIPVLLITIGLGYFWLLPISFVFGAHIYLEAKKEKYPDVDDNEDALLDHIITE